MRCSCFRTACTRALRERVMALTLHDVRAARTTPSRANGRLSHTSASRHCSRLAASARRQRPRWLPQLSHSRAPAHRSQGEERARVAPLLHRSSASSHQGGPLPEGRRLVTHQPPTSTYQKTHPAPQASCKRSGHFQAASAGHGALYLRCAARPVRGESYSLALGAATGNVPRLRVHINL